MTGFFENAFTDPIFVRGRLVLQRDRRVFQPANPFIRSGCNLFHGRKLIKENEIDRQLVHLAFDILHPLFKKYLKKRGII